MEQEINLYDEIMSQQFVDWSGWQLDNVPAICRLIWLAITLICRSMWVPSDGGQQRLVSKTKVNLMNKFWFCVGFGDI